MKYLRVILIVLLLVCCALWVASYWRSTWISSDGALMLGIQNGSFSIAIFDSDMGLPYGLTTYGFTAGLHTNLWPIVWITTHRKFWVLRGTFWLPTLLLALPVAISASPWARRRRRAKQGLCIRCGYDLTGTDHTLCPECGSSTSRARQ